MESEKLKRGNELQKQIDRAINLSHFTEMLAQLEKEFNEL